MTSEPVAGAVVDTITLRFEGTASDGSQLHELRASHVAEVLQGLVGLSSDFSKAGIFGDGPSGSEVLVRPAREGSFLLEVIRFVQENSEVIAATGVPSLGTIIFWATRSARAQVKDFDYLENGNVKVVWQDDTVDEIPQGAWKELQKRDRKRKKQLRQIMAPLSDPQVTSVEVQSPPPVEPTPSGGVEFTLTRPDYDAVLPDDDTSESQAVFETEAQMSAIDFDNPAKWRVKTREQTRTATVEDNEFLGRVARGLAIRATDVFRLQVREDTVVANGRTRRTWTVLKVESYRRALDDNDE